MGIESVKALLDDDSPVQPSGNIDAVRAMVKPPKPEQKQWRFTDTNFQNKVIKKVSDHYEQEMLHNKSLGDFERDPSDVVIQPPPAPLENFLDEEERMTLQYMSWVADPEARKQVYRATTKPEDRIVPQAAFMAEDWTLGLAQLPFSMVNAAAGTDIQLSRLLRRIGQLPLSAVNKVADKDYQLSRHLPAEGDFGKLRETAFRNVMEPDSSLTEKVAWGTRMAADAAVIVKGVASVASHIKRAVKLGKAYKVLQEPIWMRQPGRGKEAVKAFDLIKKETGQFPWPKPTEPTGIMQLAKTENLMAFEKGKAAAEEARAAVAAGVKRPMVNPLHSQEGRRLFMQAQAVRESEGKWQRVSRDVNKAQKQLENPQFYQTLEQQIAQGAMIRPEDQVASELLLNQESTKLFNNVNDINQGRKTFELMTGYQEGVSATASRLRLHGYAGKEAGANAKWVPGADEPLKEFIARNLFYVDEKTRKAYLAAKNPAKKAKVADKWHKRVMKVMEKWERDGLKVSEMDRMVVSDLPEYLQFRFAHDLRNVTEGGQAGWWAPVQEVYRSGLMSAPTTGVRNALGGLYALGDVMVVKPAANFLRTLVRQGTMMETVEALHHSVLSPQAWARASKDAWYTFRYEIPALEFRLGQVQKLQDVEFYMRGAIPNLNIGRVPIPVGSVVRSPVTATAAVDEFVKTMHIHNEVAAEAVRLGKQAGIKPYSRQMVNFVDDMVRDTKSPAYENAIRSWETWRATFQNKARWPEKALLGIRKTVPPAGLVTPFIKTGAQLSYQGGMMSPLGDFVTASRLTRRLVGKVFKGGKVFDSTYSGYKFSVDVARNMMGHYIVGQLDSLRKDENGNRRITGSAGYFGSTKNEQNLRNEIAPPLSINMGDYWLSYANLGPLTEILAFGINTLEAMDEADIIGRKKAFDRWVSKMAGMGMDATYYRGLGDLFKAATDDTYREYWTANLASSFIPNYIDSHMRAKDEYVREHKITGEEGERPTWGERVMRKGFPTSTVLPPPKVDFYGNDVKKYMYDRPMTMYGINFLAPIIIRNTYSDERDKILQRVARYNYEHPESKHTQWFSDLGHTVTSSLDKKDRQMDEDMYYRHSRLTGLARSLSLLSRDWPEEFGVPEMTAFADIRRETSDMSLGLVTAYYQALEQNRPDVAERIKEKQDLMIDMYQDRVNELLTRKNMKLKK